LEPEPQVFGDRVAWAEAVPYVQYYYDYYHGTYMEELHIRIPRVEPCSLG
jgi:hypothetical protein